MSSIKPVPQHSKDQTQLPSVGAQSGQHQQQPAHSQISQQPVTKSDMSTIGGIYGPQLSQPKQPGHYQPFLLHQPAEQGVPQSSQSHQPQPAQLLSSQLGMQGVTSHSSRPVPFLSQLGTQVHRPHSSQQGSSDQLGHPSDMMRDKHTEEITTEQGGEMIILSGTGPIWISAIKIVYLLAKYPFYVIFCSQTIIIASER